MRHPVDTVWAMTTPGAEALSAAIPTGLTGPQLDAVAASDPLLCVLAGAGAGKTRVLTLRVARRVHDVSAQPDHILVCTFSRKAAEELRRRLWILGVGDGIHAGTFHRTALSLLRQQRADRNLAPPSVLPDRRSMLSNLLLATGAGGGELTPPGPHRGRSGAPRYPSVAQLEAEIGWAKARLVTAENYQETAIRHRRRAPRQAGVIAELYHRYELARRRLNLLDLDDLLLACGDMLSEDRRFAEAVRWRFRHLFVDEMQDVNAAQFRLLMFLLGDEPDLFVVGDPNQSVYGWNGADPTLLNRLPEILPGTRVIRLNDNHRCSPQVVQVASVALGLESEHRPTSTRSDGPIPHVVIHDTDADEADWVARQAWFARRPGRRWSHVAVLARTNAQLVVVAEALRRAHLPFQVAGGELGPASDVASELAGQHRPEDEADDEDDIEDAEPLEGDGGSDDAGPGERVDDRDGIVLATFHRAKGLQWPAVFVIGLCDGLVPITSARTDAARGEERRLLYVALTRAEDDLACSWARFRDHRHMESGSVARRPSPWLAEMETACAELTPKATAPDPDVVSAHLASARAALAAREAPRG